VCLFVFSFVRSFVWLVVLFVCVDCFVLWFGWLVGLLVRIYKYVRAAACKALATCTSKWSRAPLDEVHSEIWDVLVHRK
jgi:uncharacterized membrane protein YagU involved in acid resistance